MNPLNFPKEREFLTAREFLDSLRLSNEAWSFSSEWRSRWIFRGQSDASKSLLPRAWRSTTRDKRNLSTIDFIQHHKDSIGTLQKLGFERVLVSWPDGEIKQPERQNMFNLLEQVYAEVRSISEFIDVADLVGHDINRINLEKVVDNYLYQFRGINDNDYDDIWTGDIVALAQHHGIPTRLLDWTSNSLVAAFFAAEGVAYDVSTPESKLAVYSLDTRMTNRRVQIIKVPRHKNAFLHAQSGLFTYDSQADHWFINHGSWPSLESAILEEAKLDQATMTNQEFRHYLNGLCKFTLPVSEAGELLRLLWLEGISRAHLMPTLDNVASALKSQMYWAEKQNPDRVFKEEK